MKIDRNSSVIDPANFLRSMRDAGYMSLASAVAELVDNSIEAKAKKVSIIYSTGPVGAELAVVDDGIGMTAKELELSLRFGGSGHYDSRSGAGRFGMGLPASSLSQALRVDVHTWRNKGSGYTSYLDMDEIISGKTPGVPEPRRYRAPTVGRIQSPHRGTIVTWTKCDRLTEVDLRKLEGEIARIFRHSLWRGLCIRINGRIVCPIDPLFVQMDGNTRATQYGPDMLIPVDELLTHRKKNRSPIRIRWSELPIVAWSELSNAEKRRLQTVSRPGMYITRAGREIDHGWYFFGAKRKENYDAWWRAELEFEPELDRLFGVNTLKQGIRPSAELIRLLTPHVERTAYDIHRRVRTQFAQLQVRKRSSRAIQIAQSRDRFLEPPTRVRKKQGGGIQSSPRTPSFDARRLWRGGLEYTLMKEPLRERSAFVPTMRRGKLVVTLNSEHPLVIKVFSDGQSVLDGANAKAVLELLLLSYSRAEMSMRGGEARVFAASLRQHWSDVLHLFFA